MSSGASKRSHHQTNKPLVAHGTTIKGEEDEDEDNISEPSTNTFEMIKGRRPACDGSQRSKNAQFFLCRFQGSVSALADTLYRCDQPGRDEGSSVPEEVFARFFMARIAEIILSMPFAVTQGLILGNLSAARHANEQIAQDMERTTTHAIRYKHPCIYYIALVDENGVPPTLLHLHGLLTALESYNANTHDLAQIKAVYAIDKSFPGGNRPANHESTKNGFRRYTVSVHDQEKNATLRQFVDALRKRVEDMAWRPTNKPISAALAYVGFTSNAEARFKEHKSHQNSNWLMNLVEATLCALYRGAFRIDVMPVFLLWDAGQAKLAEIVITRLSQVYTDHGGGFVSTYPGRSTKGADAITDEISDQLIQYRDDHSPFLAQMMSERQRALSEDKVRPMPVPDIDRVLRSLQCRNNIVSFECFQRYFREAFCKTKEWISNAPADVPTHEILEQLIDYETNKLDACEWFLKNALTDADRELYSWLMHLKEQSEESEN
ncbi:MAG: hypothetical protein M1831_005642 [Alyxoria varia]|nr:MAG: hypothetical protein M1831_005642 [Alyxoria varia]